MAAASNIEVQVNVTLEGEEVAVALYEWKAAFGRSLEETFPSKCPLAEAALRVASLRLYQVVSSPSWKGET